VDVAQVALAVRLLRHLGQPKYFYHTKHNTTFCISDTLDNKTLSCGVGDRFRVTRGPFLTSPLGVKLSPEGELLDMPLHSSKQ
jgi:hypothetical protein